MKIFCRIKTRKSYLILKTIKIQHSIVKSKQNKKKKEKIAKRLFVLKCYKALKVLGLFEAGSSLKMIWLKFMDRKTL